MHVKELGRLNNRYIYIYNIIYEVILQLRGTGDAIYRSYRDKLVRTTINEKQEDETHNNSNNNKDMK